MAILAKRKGMVGGLPYEIRFGSMVIKVGRIASVFTPHVSLEYEDLLMRQSWEDISAQTQSGPFLRRPVAQFCSGVDNWTRVSVR